MTSFFATNKFKIGARLDRMHASAHSVERMIRGMKARGNWAGGWKSPRQCLNGAKRRKTLKIVWHYDAAPRNLIWVKEFSPAPAKIPRLQGDRTLAIQDIEIVVLAVSAFSLFGIVLAWASWTESRDAAKQRNSQDARSAKRELIREKH